MEFFGMSGEKLGIIGGSDSSQKEEIPEWKRAFTSLPSVSVRKGIASNFDMPYEDTSTFVLTTSSGKFVDIRLPLGIYPDDEEKTSIVSHPSFWAFSGLVKTSFLEPPSTDAPSNAVTMPHSAHAIFEHVLDSKGPGIVDEGDMFLLPNGDTMEVGIWTNPSTGKYEMYKEYWTQPEPDPGRSTQNAEGGASPPPLSKSPCFVAETVGNEKGRGIFIRIGDFAQGLFQPNDTSTQILFARYELRHSPRMPGEVDSGNSHREWQIDPRSTGAVDVFPTNLCFNDGGHHTVGSRASTPLTGSWELTESSDVPG